jgi:hypothetical protein
MSPLKAPRTKSRELPAAEPVEQERPSTSEKVMQTFRMPLDLVYAFKAEATARGLDATAHVVRALDGYHRYYGLPRAVAERLEEDRRELGMDRYEYFQHVLYRRSEAVQEKGVAFDQPGNRKATK